MILPNINDSLLADQSSLSELMNMAWASHEITIDFIENTFQWFDNQQK